MSIHPELHRGSAVAVEGAVDTGVVDFAPV